MKEMNFETDMHCEKCVVRLGSVLDKDHRIHHWSSDLKQVNKTVTIHGDLTQTEAADLINKAGVKVKHHIHTPTKDNKFWSDRLVWKRAGINTMNCLIGCTIGDFGMIIYLQVYHPGTPMWLQMVLAIIAGLITSIALETSLLHLREKLAWKPALKMALSMSLISMVGMEIVMNTTDFMITGGRAQLSSLNYWLAFLPAALAGFIAPLPYNYYQLKKNNRKCH